MVTSNGDQLPWMDKLRYLGTYIMSDKIFKCCFDNAKKSFFHAFNAVFGRIGRIASEEVNLSLVKSKCLPCLLFGTEVCFLNKSALRSLNFTVTRVLMKIFHTYSDAIIKDCQVYFKVYLLSIDTIIKCRTLNFLRFGRTVFAVVLLDCCTPKTWG